MVKKVSQFKASELTRLQEIAVDAALSAGKVIRKNYQTRLRVREKPGQGLVTHVDMAAEAAAIRILKKGAPDFGFLTEETFYQGKQLAHQRGLWILDPLDGTTNFVHGFPMFCVTIAAEVDHHSLVAVTYHPILDELYTAIVGRGAFVNGKRMKVAPTSKIKDALLSTGFVIPDKKVKSLETEMSAFEKLSLVARAVRRPGSAALDLAYTARGVFDGFWEKNLKPWDVAAGALLIQEAGGKVTDFEGKPFRSDAGSVLATNGKLHRQIQLCLD